VHQKLKKRQKNQHAIGYTVKQNAQEKNDNTTKKAVPAADLFNLPQGSK
jgi:hypothetical protein